MTDDSDQCLRELPESGPRSTPEDHHRRMPVPAGKSHPPWPSSLTQEPHYRPTRLLAAVVWLHLKCKFFNGGTTKEASTTFDVQAKQLSKLLSGKVYLDGSTGAAKGKCKWSHTVAHEGDVAGDKPPSLFPPPPRNKHHSSPAVAVQVVLKWDSYMTTHK